MYVQKEMKLSERHRRFAIEYAKDLNATAAYLRAGYTGKGAKQSANRLLNMPEIKALLQNCNDKIAAKAELSAAYVLDGIKRVIERCEQAEPVVDREGKPTGEYRFDAQACLKGQELLGKHLKLFTEKHEVKVETELSALTDEELKLVIATGTLPGKKSDA